MSDYIGTREQVDEYIGSRLVEAAYLGSRKYFDAYSEITGSLPLTYESRIEHVLKNYALYGSASGAGVETENLFNVKQGYVYNSRDVGLTLCKLDIQPGETIYLTRTTELYTRIAYYDANNTRLTASAYVTEGYASVVVRELSDLSYCIVEFKNPEGTILTAQQAATIAETVVSRTIPTKFVPYGYKIPLSIEGEPGDNIFDPNAQDTDNGYVVNAYLNYQDETVSLNAWRISEYIEVEPSQEYLLKNAFTSVTNPSFCVYDASKNYISGTKYEGYNTNVPMQIPANGKYIRFSFIYANANSIVLEKTNSSAYDLYIGLSKLGAEEYLDFAEQKVYKLKEVHKDTVTVNGIEWDILGYDHDEVYKADGVTRAQHTVTIQTHDCITDLQFDAPEAFYYAENGLAAGDYYFTIDPTYDASRNTYKDTGYQFTLANDVPAGGVLTFPWSSNAQASEVKVSAYASRSATTATESVSVSSGTTGTNLGQLTTVGDPANNLNSIQRVRFGSNNWKQSAMRQYLNSDKAAGTYWTPQTKFDRPPSWNASADGYLYGMDPDFVSVLGNVRKVTAKNSVTDGGGTETTSEKVFLLSLTEAYCGGSEGTAYDYYKNYSDLSAAGYGADTNRIKYRNNAAKVWWLRSENTNSANHVRLVSPSGALSDGNATNSLGVVSACCIILDDINTNPYLQSLFLKPVDPPVPLPAILTYQGENTLSSTETLGEATIKGRINELPNTPST